MPVYKQKLPSGKTRTFIKGQHRGVAWWQTVESFEDGQQIETEKIADIDARWYAPRGICLGDYFDKDYLPFAKREKPTTWNNERQIFNRAIRPVLGEKVIGDIDPRTVRAWVLLRTETKTTTKKERKLSTVNREIAVLSQIFSLAVNDELIDRNPCAKVKRFSEDLHRIEYLTQEEEAKLLAACTGSRAWIAPIITVALYTGLRPGKSELFSLQVSHCDFAQNVIILTHHKTAKRTGVTRIIPMNTLVRSILWRFCEGNRPGAYLFARKCNETPYRRFFKTYKKAATAAALPDSKSIPYILRHTFGTRLAQAGIGIAEIKELMGHKDVKMTLRYVHSSIESKHSAVERLLTPSSAKS